jgi:hypothetical protein
MLYCQVEGCDYDLAIGYFISSTYRRGVSKDIAIIAL